MPNIAVALREEITRLSRKESRKQLLQLKKASRLHRKDLAAVKRLLHSLQAELARVKRGAGRAAAEPAEQDGPSFRFSLKGFVARRRRSGLSAGDYGRLIGVSAQTIYNWEHGKARPRRAQLAKLNELRTLGKREATARLESLGGAPAPAGKRKARKPRA